MSLRTASSLRTKIVAVLASLVALWAFAAVVTVREGVNVVWFATLEQRVGKSTEAVVAAIQVERRESVAALSDGAAGGAAKGPLLAARSATDSAIRQMLDEQRGTLAQWSMQGSTHARLAEFRAALATLAAGRSRFDAGSATPEEAAAYFTGLVHDAEAVYDTFTVWDDASVIYQTSTLVMMTQAQEMMSEEDALMAGVLGMHRLTDADRASFAQQLGVERYLTTTIDGRLDGTDGAAYRSVLGGTAVTALRRAEDQVVQVPAGKAPNIDPARWRTTAASAIDALRRLILTLADLTVDRTRGTVIWVVVRLILAAGLGLIAVVASIRFSVRTVRGLQTQLAALRTSALDLAQVRLPRVVAQLRNGEVVDIEAAAPPLAHGTDDIGQVGAAFNVVQETAIRATVEQADLRRGVRDVFLNLARRSQAIVHRQLKLLDAMERRADSETELAELFRVDHLATRMRRNAENLILLSGSTPGRVWRAPVSMVDVVRGALGEIEEYTRVTVRSVEPCALAGRAVGDVIHLLAELMENAAVFSPSNTVVQVTGEHTADGYAIDIEDRGLGLTPPDLDDANTRIAEPPEFQLSATSRLGFYVVGRLAQRHQIRVRLRTSPYAGTTATVVLPAALLFPATVREPVDVSPGAGLLVAGSGSPSAASPAASPTADAAPRSTEPAARSDVPAARSDVPAARPDVRAARSDVRAAGSDVGSVAGAELAEVDMPQVTKSGLPVRVRKTRPLLAASGLDTGSSGPDAQGSPRAAFEDVGSHGTARDSAARPHLPDAAGGDRAGWDVASGDVARGDAASGDGAGYGSNGSAPGAATSGSLARSPWPGNSPGNHSVGNSHSSAISGPTVNGSAVNGSAVNGLGTGGRATSGQGTSGSAVNAHPSGGWPTIGGRPNGRDPVEIRRLMTAYQDGAKRARSDAAGDPVVNPASRSGTSQGVSAQDITTNGARSDRASSDHARSDHASSDHASSDHASSDRTPSDRTGSDRSGPDRTTSGRTRMKDESP